jgi:hypothetical protein
MKGFHIIFYHDTRLAANGCYLALRFDRILSVVQVLRIR